MNTTWTWQQHKALHFTLYHIHQYIIKNKQPKNNMTLWNNIKHTIEERKPWTSQAK